VGRALNVDPGGPFTDRDFHLGEGTGIGCGVILDWW